MQTVENIEEAIVLVGGLGTRLRSVVADRPKPLADVSGRPFLCWLLDDLWAQGIKRVVLATGYQSDAFESLLDGRMPRELEIVYSKEEEPLGTGGALIQAARHIQGTRCFALNGDSFCHIDLSVFARQHVASVANWSLWLVQMEDCRRFGTVEISAQNEILAFWEKSNEKKSGLINAGVYLFDVKPFVNGFSLKPLSLENDIFPGLIGNGLFGFIGQGPFIDIGLPESYKMAAEFFNNQVAIDNLKSE